MANYHRDNYIKNFMGLFSPECNFFDTVERQPKNDIPNSCLNKGEGGIFIWGDSHAKSLSYGIRKSFSGENISQITTSNCRPLVKEDTELDGEYRVACDRANAKAKDEILKIKPKVIILVQHIDHDKNDYNEIFRTSRNTI
ncbi:SGNH hydrolase domain-containing protein [Psychromonas sp. KJ10-2]|uniref:SGNH hydrolase domain-containing protein n=1 Tax=Psychromonas sp. KJ10-2 TaxID=3391822 RepID=UPI0039B5D1E2